MHQEPETGQKEKPGGSRLASPRSRRLWIGAVCLLATVAAAAVAAAILASILPGGPQRAEPPASEWPTEHWATSTPQGQGMETAKLQAMMALVDEKGIGIDAIVVARHGQIVFEAYRSGYQPNTRHGLASVTKSVTSMLVGIAIHQGFIGGVSDTVAELLPDRAMANPDARKERLTLEHLLTMSAGLDWPEHDLPYTDHRNIVSQMWRCCDPVQFVLDRPMAREPGQAWAYNSGASVLLGAILEEATGRDLLDYAQEVLFEPTGIGPVSWRMGAGGYYDTGGGRLTRLTRIHECLLRG